jgi:hypothetical protein
LPLLERAAQLGVLRVRSGKIAYRLASDAAEGFGVAESSRNGSVVCRLFARFTVLPDALHCVRVPCEKGGSDADSERGGLKSNRCPDIHSLACHDCLLRVVQGLA